jgi:serine protease AprX
MFRVNGSTTKIILAITLIAMLVLPMVSVAIPLDRPTLLDRDKDGGEAEATGADLVWPVITTERVPLSQRDWLVQAHENGRPYPPQLLTTLGPMGYDETVSVIVQFRDGTDDADRTLLDRLGLRLVHRWVGIDACHVEGPVGAVWRLVDSGRTWYVEPDLPLVHDMEVGTRVINASRVWATVVQQQMSTPSAPIDGTGVTAVVVDTGIDASHPDLDYGIKTLFNLRSDTGDGPYYETENSDLGYGHGTHVAGTVAGNGDASAGARRGVAPGANLIGITIDTDNSAGYIGSLDWVWQNSRPGNNPHNIRVYTNSWHTTVEEYDPQKALIVLINSISFENNVVSTWSAGNDGRNDPEGNELTTSGQGNTPVALMCAAFERDGSGVADFSSRGKRGLSHTYPDVGAPGVTIWSAAARRTIISAGSYVGSNNNPYYLAISGTSMSTPHLAGLVALLWQAAPSMRISEKHEDHSGDPGDWFERDDTRIHEAEWIIEASADYLWGGTGGGSGIPEHDEELDGYGVDGEPIDYVQGYGLVNAERAVAVALALEQLRVNDPHKDITVPDALEAYSASLEEGEEEVATDQMFASWEGEWGRFTESESAFFQPYSANQSKFIWIPEGTETVDVEVIFPTVSLRDKSVGTLTWTVDFGADGSVDQQGDISPSLTGVRKATVTASGHEGQYWAVGVLGRGVKMQNPTQVHNYMEVRIEYVTSVVAHMSSGAGALLVEPPDLQHGYYHAYTEPWTALDPSMDYGGGTLIVPHLAYNVTRIELGGQSQGVDDTTSDSGGGGVLWWLLLVLAVVVLALLYMRYRERIDLRRRVKDLGDRTKVLAGRVTRRSTG